jgi:hypothetical protein
MLTSRITEIVDDRIARVELHQAEGSLLDRRGVGIDGGPAAQLGVPPAAGSE